MSNQELINQLNEGTKRTIESVNGTTRRLVKEISKDDLKNSYGKTTLNSLSLTLTSLYDYSM